MKTCYIVCYLCICLFISPAAQAQSGNSNEDATYCRELREDNTKTLGRRLNNLSRKGCLGGENDPDSLSVWVLERTSETKTGRNNVTREILFTLSEKLSELAATSAQYTELTESLMNSVQAISQSPIQINDYLQSEHYRYDPMTGRIGRWLPVKREILTADCASKKSITESCVEPFDLAQITVRYATLVADTVNYFRSSEISGYADRLSFVDQQWTLYATEARSQFLWELMWNGSRFEKTLEDDRKNNVSRRLLTAPPSSQVIFVHPGIAFEYVGNADSGSKFAPALMMEWIGFNRWKWAESGLGGEKSDAFVRKAKMKNAWGASLVSSLSDRSGTGNLRHGVVAHYDNRYSLGATYGDGDIGIFFSLDVMAFVTSKQKRIESVQKLIRLGD